MRSPYAIGALLASFVLLAGAVSPVATLAAPPPTPVLHLPSPTPRLPVAPSPTPIRQQAPAQAPQRLVNATPTPVYVLITATPARQQAAAAAATATRVPVAPTQQVRSTIGTGSSTIYPGPSAAFQAGSPDPLWLPALEETGPTPRPQPSTSVKTTSRPAAASGSAISPPGDTPPPSRPATAVTPRPAAAAPVGGATTQKAGASTKAPVNFTPSGSAGGGQAPSPHGSSTRLLELGVIILTAGGSWSVYYFLRAPKD